MLTPVLPAGAAADLSGVAPAIVQASGKARRDIALVPLLVIGGGALALVVSQLLRPGAASSGPAGLTIVLASFTAGVCAAWLPARRLVRSAGSRVLFRAYSAAGGVLVAGVTAIAAFDLGLTNPALSATVLVAPSAGLALPQRWSVRTIIAIVAALLVVQVVNPVAGLREATTIISLAIAGWVVGLILRRGHRGASRDALLLSRGDQLTGVLNRRGFIENLARELDRAARRGEPLLLLTLGPREGLGAATGQGDEDDDLFAAVARIVARELPPGASLGRLASRRLGVCIPGGRTVDADWFAATVRAAVEERWNLYFGAASAPDGSAPLTEVFDVAEACLQEARRRSPEGVQLSEVFGPPIPGRQRPPVRRPPVSYEALRNAGGPPSTFEPWGIDGQWLFAGMSTVALAGLLFFVGSLAEGGAAQTPVVAYGGLPWVATALLVGFAYRRHPRSAGHPPLLPVLVGSALVLAGVAAAALSTGSGALSPIVAGLYLKLFFDASTFERSLARPLGFAAVVTWLVILALGPADSWWAAPFQVALLAGAFALGTLGHNAYDAATSGRLDLARTDPFTGLLDRGGFYEQGEALLAVSPPAGHGTLAVVLIDVEASVPSPRRVQRTRGPRRTAAGVVAQYLRDASVVARFGSGDFRAIVRVDSRTELDALVHRLREQVAGVSSTCRVGGAMLGPDGMTLDALLAIASHRAEQAVVLADAA